MRTDEGYYISLDFERIQVGDKDYITIFDVNDDRNSRVIASLSSHDTGPESFWPHSDWKKKIISSESNNLSVEFRSDEFGEGVGFSASIHYSPLPSNECENGLNMAMKTIQSPNYPDLYANDLSCKWLISVPHGSHIILNFLQFDVRFF